MKKERGDRYSPDKHRPKKSLGQHFLTDPNILDRVVRAGSVDGGDVVLEIGPGEGSLTEAIFRTGARIIAVEKDASLITHLENKFSKEIASGRFSLIHDDILNVAPTLEELLGGTRYKVIANIPYYITGKIIRFLFSFETLPNTVVLLVQDEVAKRITSDKESPLSLSIKAFGTPHYRGKVKAGSFSPPPKVDSAILSIENISHDFFQDLDPEVFFRTIRRVFSQKRKTLLNTLFVDDKSRGEMIMLSLGLSPTMRPEEIDIDNWKQLIHSL